MQKWYLGSLLLVMLTLLVAGCGGGGGGALISNNQISPSTNLTVSADTANGGAGMVKRAVIAAAPLDAGATIDVYDFKSGLKVASGVIGNTGTGVVTVPPSITALVVITGTRAGKNYRLSYIIPSVPVVDTAVEATPVSSLAAEMLTHKYYKQSVLDQATVDQVTTAAASFLGTGTHDISLGGGLLNQTATVGASNAVSDTLVNSSVGTAVPATIDDSLVRSKNAMQQLQDAALPMSTIADAEAPSVSGVYQSMNEATNAVGIPTVSNDYGALASRMNTMLMPLIQGNVQLTTTQYDSVGQPASLLDLPIGHGYTMQSSPFGLQIYPANSNSIAGQITIKYPMNGTTTYTLVVKEPATGNWSVEQTSSSDAKLDYIASFPGTAVLLVNPSFTGSITLTDSALSKPITFNGTAQATGADAQHYTDMKYTGTLSSQEVNMKGTVEVTFPATLPATAPAWNQTYDYPLSCALTNASLTVTGTTASVTIAGTVSAALSIYAESDGPQVEMTSFALTNGSITVSGPNQTSVTISGSANATLVPSKLPNGNYNSLPTEYTLSDATIDLKTSTNEVRLVGTISLKGAIVTSAGEPNTALTSLLLKGDYSNTETQQHFTGSITGTFDKFADPPSDVNTKTWSLALKGTFTRAKYTAYDVDMVFSDDGNKHPGLVVNNLQFGPNSFHGTVTTTQDAQYNMVTAALSLTNQDNVALDLALKNGTYTGDIKASGAQVATIARDLDFGKMKVTFKDNTTMFLPF